MDGVKAIFVTYWSQTLILIGLIGYFGKRFFDLASKKIEVKFSLFYNQKLSAINTFLSAYTETESFYWQVNYFDVMERKISPIELDNISLPIYNKFIGTYYSLFLFLNSDELKDFKAIEEEINNCRSALGKLFYLEQNEKKTIAGNNYFSTYTKMLNNNRQSLINIGNKFNKLYNN